jgi:putative transposase
VDGLKNFPEAIKDIFPNTQVHVFMVRPVGHSLSYVLHRDRKDVATHLKAIYQAMTLAEAEEQLDEFEERWNERYPLIAKSRRLHWSRADVRLPR